MSNLRLTHFHAFFKKLGGVETLLRLHLKNDLDYGVDSQVVAFFEPTTPTFDKVTGIGLTWRDTIRSTRSKFSKRIATLQTGIAFYHNFWGVPFLADIDRASRRTALLHSDWPGIEASLKAQDGLLDGILCVNEVLRDQARDCLRSLGHDRIELLPLPISQPKATSSHTPLNGRPVVFGFSGRVIREQKRVDRLPEFCRTLERHQINYRFEILGDGPDITWLRKELAINPRVTFHGRKSGDDYWQILNGWDLILFTSDYEGLPISLLESLSLGVLPVYPKIRSGGDSYASRINSRFLYAPYDFNEAASLLKWLKALPEEDVAAMRETARRLTKPHQGNAYFEVYSDFIKKIANLPRVSAEQQIKRMFYWSDLLPYAVLKRIYLSGLLKRKTARKGQ